MVTIPPAFDRPARLAYLQELARQRGGRCLARAYTRTIDPVEFECAKKHRWSMTPQRLFAGAWCPTCREAGEPKQFVPHTTVPWPRPKGPATWARAVRAAAKQWGGRCLSPTPADVEERVELECAEGHRWTARMESVLKGTWCRICVRRGPAKEEQMRAIAAEHGGHLLGVEYQGHGWVRFRCKADHEWEMTQAAARAGRWCMQCESQRDVRELVTSWQPPPAGAWIARLKFIRRIARAYGGRCLSSVYSGASVTLEFECARGHQFKKAPGPVIAGAWCPSCRVRGRTASETYPGTSVARAHRDDREGRIAALHAIAAERGGRCLARTFEDSHAPLRMRCKAGHTFETNADRIFRGKWCALCAKRLDARLDRLRGLARAQGGECLSPEFPRDGQVHLRCAEGHEWKTSLESFRGRGSWCPRCAGRPALSDLQELAENAGGTLVSRRYVHSALPLKWRCSAGHVFEALPRDVRLGKWCKRCDWLGGLLGEALRAAERRGGKLLDDPGEDRDAKLRWRCKQGHVWRQRVQVIAVGYWCAKCADTRLTIGEMHRTAQKNLGRCLSTEYINSATKLLWECSEKHQWWATPNNIRRGKWCRTCRQKAAWEQRRADAKDKR